MDRRDYLKVAGAAGVASVGAYGAYTTVIRDAWSTPDGPTDHERLQDVDEEEITDNSTARDGWTLLGITPESRDLSVLDPFEEWLGKRHAIAGYFLDIGQPDEDEIHRVTNSLFESAWQRGQVPHVFWQPFLPNQDETSEEINRDIANGEWDDEIELWARSIADWIYDEDGDHRRLYINLAPEFNGDWSPWSPALGDDDEEDFVGMWQRVHNIFDEYGITEEFVQWIWTLDNTTRGVDRAACYPGDEYVDWCGIHGYNWASWEGWQTPEEVYGPTLSFIDDLTNKPVAITEFASSSETENGDHDPAAKNEWLTDAYAYLEANNVQMSLYFDLTKETDWSVFDAQYGHTTAEVDGTSYEVYPAYRDAVTNDGVLGPDPDHPRILSNAEFAGEF